MTDAAPDYTEEIVGYRAFRRDGDKLLSLNQGVEWTRGENKATCLASNGRFQMMSCYIECKGTEPGESVVEIPPDGILQSVHLILPGSHVRFQETGAVAHDAPAKNCTCGIYAFDYLDGNYAAMIPPTSAQVLGRIEAWGKIEKHKDGFRAEYARVTALSDPELAKKWDVDVLEVPEQTTYESTFYAPGGNTVSGLSVTSGPGGYIAIPQNAGNVVLRNVFAGPGQTQGVRFTSAPSVAPKKRWRWPYVLIVLATILVSTAIGLDMANTISETVASGYGGFGALGLGTIGIGAVLWQEAFR